MKWTLRIALVLSLAANGYFIVDEIRFQRNQELSKAMNGAMGLNLSKTNWKEGLQIFKKKLQEKDTALANKKYYYINIWTNWCKPCIKEMPWLDTLVPMDIPAIVTPVLDRDPSVRGFNS